MFRNGHWLNCHSKVLTRRDTRNATGEVENHSHTARAYKDGTSHSSTESQASKNHDLSQKTSSEKNDTQNFQAATVANNTRTNFGSHPKQHHLGKSTSDHISKDTNSTVAQINYSASNSSSSPSNSSDSSSLLLSKVGQIIQGNQTLANHTGNDTYTWSSIANIPAQTLSTNSSSLEQPSAADQPVQDSHHSKIKGWCIGIGSLVAVICIGVALIFAKKRLRFKKSSSAFLRRHFRSNSNDSNRAVRDRSSIGGQFRTSDPFSCPSKFSRKPLILHPESMSYVRSSNPRRASLLYLRHQGLKSQISPPFIEPPSPGAYLPLFSSSPGKAVFGGSSNSYGPSSPPSYSQSPEYRPPHSKQRPTFSLIRDPFSRKGSLFSSKAPDVPSRLSGDQIEPYMTEVPPRPPRPEFPLLPCISMGTGVFSKPLEDTDPVVPTILPLQVPHRHRRADKHSRNCSIDQVILDPPGPYTFKNAIYQDSPTLPQFHREQRNSVPSTARDPVRTSHLSRSTCYSQASEQETSSNQEENDHPDRETSPALRFVSFGMSRSSTKLEQQLDCLISNKQNDTHFVKGKNS